MSTKNHLTNLEQINSDLKSFLDFCQENRLTDEEIAKICQPLTTSIKRAKIIHHLRNAALFLLVATSLYYLTYMDALSWHLSAIARIILINLLPLWDWRHLKHDQCLIPNFINPIEPSPSVFDCALCEAIDKIYVELEIDPTTLNERYLQLHRPVILSDALQNWPILHDPNPDLLLNLKHSEALHDSLPCKLSTNLHSGQVHLGKLLKKILDFDEFFLHFQNCAFDATKAFRVVAPRPGFVPVEMSPVQYNWLLMSRNYNVSSFKPVELREAIAVVGQASGSNFFRLIPRRNCESECPILNIELTRGEALVFSSLWDLEYKPSAAGGLNVAVILEMH